MLTLLHPSNSLGEFHLRSALAFFSSSRTVGVVNSSFPTWCQSLNPKIFGRNAPQHSKEPGEATVLKVERKELLKIRKKKQKKTKTNYVIKYCWKVLLWMIMGLQQEQRAFYPPQKFQQQFAIKRKIRISQLFLLQYVFSMHQFCGFWFIFGG